MRSVFIFTKCPDLDRIKASLLNNGFVEGDTGMFIYHSPSGECIWAHVADEIPELSATEKLNLVTAGGPFSSVICLDISGRFSDLDSARTLVRRVASFHPSVLMDDYSDDVWLVEELCGERKKHRAFLDPA